MRSIRNLSLSLCLALLAIPAFGAGVISNGIDTWVTTNDGSSFIDFADEPIPAGFFCLGSEPFTARIAWEGKPLASVPADALGLADTVVQRLDDAVFDRDGVAKTRLQVRALSLRSIEPIQTSCGPFHASAALHGVQPMTEMTIRRTKAGEGTFDAKLAMNVRLTFTPARVTKAPGPGAITGIAWNRPATGRTWTLDHLVELDSPAIAWQSELPKTDLPGQVGGFVLLDTDDDGLADTYVPGQSAFHPRAALNAPTKFSSQDCRSTPTMICHPGGGKCHCVEGFNPY